MPPNDTSPNYIVSPKSPNFPSIAEADRRLRNARYQIAVRIIGVVGILSAFAILYSPGGYVGVGLAALAYFITMIFWGKSTYEPHN